MNSLIRLGCNHNHPETTDNFKVDSWYRGLKKESGVVLKCSGNPESNLGWWNSLHVKGRLITPSLWEKITDEAEIERLEKKLIESNGRYWEQL